MNATLFMEGKMSESYELLSHYNLENPRKPAPQLDLGGGGVEPPSPK